MKRRRVHCEGLNPGETAITGSAFHYMTRVVRAQVGDSLELFDGAGKRATAEISRIDPAQATVLVHDIEADAQAGATLTIAVAAPKGARADMMVEKLTEIGVDAIVWTVFERSVVQVERDGNKWQRWQRIAESAAGQSGRARLPEQLGPASLSDVLAGLSGTTLLAHPGAQQTLSEAVPADTPALTVLVGPEGGLTPAEIDACSAAGAQLVSISDAVCRVETAAIVSSALAGAALRGSG